MNTTNGLTRQMILNDYRERVLDNLTERERIVMWQSVQKLIFSMSCRSANVVCGIVRDLDSAGELLCLDETSIASLRNVGVKSVPEIMAMCNEFRALCDTMSVTPTLDVRIRREFDFLNDEEVGRVVSFIEANGYYPLFLLLCCFLRHSDCRRHELFAAYAGVTGDAPMTLEQLSERFDISRERVRQLMLAVVTRPELPFLTPDLLTRYSSLFSQHLLIETDPMVKSVVNAELPAFSPVVVLRMIMLVSGLNTCFSLATGHVMIADDDTRSVMSWQKLARHLKTLSTARRLSIKELPIADLIEEFGLVDKDKLPRWLTPAVRYFALENCGFESNRKDVLLLPPTRPDRVGIIEQILVTRGEPMTIAEIIEEFEKIEGSRINDLAVRYLCHNSPVIKPLGKRSTYGLKTWKKVNFKTIRLSLLDVLHSSDTPLTVSQLLDAVKADFPSTNWNSINTTILNDTKGRFVYFERGMIGAADKEYDSSFVPVDYNDTPHRLPPARRLQQLIAFVNSTGHFPFNGGEKEEALLYRWLVNFRIGSLNTTPEFREQVNQYIQQCRDDHIPTTQREFRFKHACEEYLQWRISHGSQPTPDTNYRLAQWYKTSKYKCASFDDLRAYYFDTLQQSLADCDRSPTIPFEY